MKHQIPYLYPLLFSEEDSPLKKASPLIKQLFTNLKFDAEEISLQLPFDNIDGMPPHCCSRKINKMSKCTNNIYLDYHCTQCSRDIDYRQMILCETCYIKEKHEGHKIVEKVSISGEQTCDCGRSLRIDEKSFCESHGLKQKKVEISQEKQNKFNEFFTQLFEIYFYLRDKDSETDIIERMLNQKLSYLCEQNLQNIKLTQRFLEASYKSKQKQSTYLVELLDSCQFVNLVRILVSDIHFLHRFAQIFIKEEEKGDKILYPYSCVRNQILDSEDVLIELANKQIFFMDKLSNYLKVTKQGNQSFQLFMKFYKKNQQKLNPKQFILLLIKDFKKNSNFNSLKTNNVKIFLIQLFVKTFNKSISFGKDDKDWFPECLILICNILIEFCGGNIVNVKNLYTLLEEGKIGVTEKQLEIFFGKLFDFFVVWNENGQKNLIPALVTLMVIGNHSHKQQMMKNAWKIFMPEEQQFTKCTQNAFNLIFFLLGSFKKYPVLALNEQQYKNKSDLQMRQQNFKSYLYQMKQVGKRTVWRQYNNGWLNFQSAPIILNKLCEYIDATEIFKFSNKTQKFPNKVFKIPEHLGRNWENIKHFQISINQKFEVNSNILKEIFTTLFSSDGFFEVFFDRFNKELKKVEVEANTEQKWKSRNVGQVYIILLLLIHKICEEKQSHLIKRELEKIINDSEYRFKFQLFGEKKKIFQILNIQENTVNVEEIMEQGKEEREKREKQEMLKKKNEKKNKLVENYEKKRAMTLMKFSTKQSEQPIEEQQEEQCLLCHEKEKKQLQKKLIYMATLKKNDTVAKVLHGDEVKTSVILNTCFHTIHIHCFNSMKKKNMGFSCPLCKQTINCYLPLNPQKTHKKVWTMSWNIMNALLVTQFEVYNASTPFHLFFEAYVESKGISRIILQTLQLSESSRREKMKKYLDSLIMNCYERLTVEEKENANQEYQLFQNKIQSCTKEHFKNFQKFIVQVCWESIKNGYANIDCEFLSGFLDKMVETEAEIFVKALQQICGETSEYDFSQLYQKVKDKQKQKMEEKQCYVFGSNFLRPYKTMQQVLKKKSESTCDACSGKNVNSQCMICQRIFCRECQDDEIHKQIHCKKSMGLYFDDGCIKINKETRLSSETIQLYFNDFQIHYNDGRSNDKHSMVYKLNERNLERALGVFLNFR